MENQANIEPKSVKNQPKFQPKSINNRSKSKNVTHFVLGAVLEASWRRLGRVLGANIVPSWLPKSKENRSKSDAKIYQKNDAFQVAILILFGGFLEGKWRHVGTKINEQSIQTARSEFLINRALAAAGA